MHSPETGGPEMLIELAYRLVVEETPFIQNIRNNVITLITPVHRGRRPREAGRHLLLQQEARAGRRAAAADVLGQVRRSTTTTATAWASSSSSRRTMTKTVPRVDADDHCTTCTRRRPTSTRRPAPARTTTRSIRSPIDEWWMLAKNDVMEMTKRGVPGVWTYGFYDGWVPNYMFFIAHSHNAIGRFYEVQSYGPDNSEVPSRRDDARAGVVPAESAAAVHQVGPAQQHQHPGVGAALLAQSRGEEPAAVPRELLAEEQARGRQGEEPARLRVGDSREPAAQGRRGRRGERAAAQGSRSTARPTSFKAGDVQRGRGRLHRPRRSAVPHARRHVLLGAELSAAESVRRTTTPAGRSS